MIEKKIFNLPAFLILFKRLCFFVSIGMTLALVWGYVEFQTVGQWDILKSWVFDFLPSTIITFTLLTILTSLISLSVGSLVVYSYVYAYLSFVVDANGIVGPSSEKLFPERKYVLFQDIKYMGLDLLGRFVVHADQAKLGAKYKLNRFDEFYLRKLIREAVRGFSYHLQ